MIRRAPREQGFTVLQNETLEDDRLSWEAVGLLSFLLSKPDDWTVSKQHLISCRDAGDHKIKRILGELQEAGYLKRKRTQDEEGKFVWESVIFETPRGDGESIPRKSIDGSSTDGSSIDGKPPDITKKDSNKEGSNKQGGDTAPAREDSEITSEEELTMDLVDAWRSVRGSPPLTKGIEDTLFRWAREGEVTDADKFEDVLRDAVDSTAGRDVGIDLAVLRKQYQEDEADATAKYMPTSDPDLDV
jgi:hypothetical protein